MDLVSKTSPAPCSVCGSVSLFSLARTRRRRHLAPTHRAALLLLLPGRSRAALGHADLRRCLAAAAVGPSRGGLSLQWLLLLVRGRDSRDAALLLQPLLHLADARFKGLELGRLVVDFLLPVGGARSALCASFRSGMAWSACSNRARA